MTATGNDADQKNARLCRQCGYVIDHLPENRCPECGRPFDPDDPSTYRTAGRRAKEPLRLTRVGLGLLVFVGLSLIARLFPDARVSGFYLLALLVAGVVAGLRTARPFDHGAYAGGIGFLAALALEVHFPRASPREGPEVCMVLVSLWACLLAGGLAGWLATRIDRALFQE